MDRPEQTTKKSGRPVVFGLNQDLCIWAKAGLVKPVQCLNAFDCLSCPLDQKIREDRDQGRLTMSSDKPYAWFLDLPAWGRLAPEEKKCRHMISGRVPYKMCSRGFDCATCPFDEQLMDPILDHHHGRVPSYQVAGFALAPDHYFHRGHAWARVEYGGRVRVGLDDFALRLVGGVDGLQLPDLGDAVAQTEPVLTLTRGDHAARVLSPVDGVVVARNHQVLSDPAAMKQSPYDQGWLLVIQPGRLKNNLKNLLFGPETDRWIEDETNRLVALVARETGYQLAATGGQFVDDVFGQAPDIGWDRLVREFLLT